MMEFDMYQGASNISRKTLDNKNVCVPGKAAVEMKSKVFYMVLLRYLHIIYMDRWARFASRSECHMDRLSFISFHMPSVSPGLDFEEGGLEFLGWVPMFHKNALPPCSVQKY
jgi:hypothetical protein